MNSLIFSFIPATATSMVASTKVAWFVSEQLEIPLVWNETVGEYRDLDVLLLVNGAYAYCKHLEPLSHAILGAKHLIWIQQDYSIVPPINNGEATSPFRKAFVDRRLAGKSHLNYWTTCERESRLTPLSSYVNWNCLSMQRDIPKIKKNNQLVYYGSFRAGRLKHFDKFFKDPLLDVVISSPSNKFAKTYIHRRIKHCGPPADLINWLAHFGLGLYLEDRKSHSEFHSPPNRFYEMLSAGLPMVFQQEAGFTLRKAGYKDVDQYTINTALNVVRKMDSREVIRQQQLDAWHSRALDERTSLPLVLKQAWKKIETA